MQPFDRWLNDSAESRLRLHTLVRLRWFGVGGQLTTIAFVYWWLGFDLPLGGCLLAIATSAWINVFLQVRYPVRFRLSRELATALLVYDVLQLALLLYLTGGVLNPFALLLVAPVTVSAATMPFRNTVILGLVTIVAAIVLVYWHRPLPWAPGRSFDLPTLYKLGVLTAIVACMVFLALYAFRLSREARQMATALSATEMVLAREQRLHALDGLAAAAAHELGTPLGTIVLVTKELERDMPVGSPFLEDIRLLGSQAARCREILQKLTRRPSDQDPHHAALPVTQLLQEAAEPYRAAPNRVVIWGEALPGVEGPHRYEPVGERQPGVIFGLGNIIENAVDFAREQVAVAARWNEREVVITVTDDGPGFAPEIKDTLGEPYVTTRPQRDGRVRETGGLGLGFFIAKTLLERSGAVVTMANRERPENGAIVTVVWERSGFQGLQPQDAARRQHAG